MVFTPFNIRETHKNTKYLPGKPKKPGKKPKKHLSGKPEGFLDSSGVPDSFSGFPDSFSGILDSGGGDDHNSEGYHA